MRFKIGDKVIRLDNECKGLFVKGKPYTVAEVNPNNGDIEINDLSLNGSKLNGWWYARLFKLAKSKNRKSHLPNWW